MQETTIDTESGSTIVCGSNGISFFSETKKVGLWNLRAVMEVDGETESVSYEEIEQHDNALSVVGRVGNTDIECETTIRGLDCANAVKIGYRLTNMSEGRVYHLSGLRTVQGAPGLWLPHHRPYDLRYCHTDNVRTERYPFCQTEAPYVRALPTQMIRCGVGEDQPLPAIYLTDRDYTNGIVIGGLSQRKTYQSFEMRRSARPDDSIFDVFKVHHELPLARGYTLDLGDTLDVDDIYLELLNNTHPQDAYQSYVQYLSEQYELRGQTTSLRDEALYCTWNYGRMAQQVEDELLTTAEFISDNFPRMKFFLVDAGYTFRQVDRSGLGTNDSLDVMYNGPDQMLNPDKIADMRSFTDRIRDLGLRPGLWWTPTAMLDSDLFADHPDWFLRTVNGAPYRIGDRKGFLDLTVPGAREFVDSTLEVILGEWGMDATKMDFWSQCFEARNARVQQPNTTAAETRRLLFQLVRKHLPDDGVFMTCVATGMGNPFIGEHADTYRNTIDIGDGKWQDQIGASYWALPVLGLPGRKTLLHNNDSAGINLECPDNENFFRLTWCFITMGMQEIGGALEDLPPKYVKAMRKYTDRCERGFRCLCPDESAFRGEPLPDCLYVNYPPGSRTREEGIKQSVALFNWTDERQTRSVRRDKLGHSGEVMVEDFWTEERDRWTDEFLVEKLDGRSARLYDILV